jgi:uncharacterized protein YfbU (UPF0304 family)
MTITLTKKDRLILINQYRILAELNKAEESRYLELIDILECGYEVFYSMVDEWISEDMPESEGRFVLDVLNLYRAIEDVKRSSRDPLLINHHMSIFPGFDGNNESEYLGFCRFLLEKQGKFQEQQQYLAKNDGMNSHMPMIDKYRRMLKAAGDIGIVRRLSPEDVIAILEA